MKVSKNFTQIWSDRNLPKIHFVLQGDNGPLGVSPNLGKEKKKHIPSFNWEFDWILIENNTTYRLNMNHGWQWVHLPY